MLGKKRIRKLEKRMDDLERKLNRETDVFPKQLSRFRYPLRSAVLRIIEHLGLEFEYVPPDKCRLVEKIDG